MNPFIHSFVVRGVRPQRAHSPLQLVAALEASTYRCVTDADRLGVMSMPQAESSETDVYFFTVLDPVDHESIEVTGVELDRLYRRFTHPQYSGRGLQPDIWAQAQVNLDDPDFCRVHPNAAGWWIHDYNRFAAASFSLKHGSRPIDDQRLVKITSRHDRSWAPGWWFAGVPL